VKLAPQRFRNNNSVERERETIKTQVAKH
jgi:hypothetical protein